VVEQRQGIGDGRAEQLRLAHFSSIAYAGTHGCHKEVSAMARDSRAAAAKLKKSVRAAHAKLTKFYERRAFAELQFRFKNKLSERITEQV
jgi:hypothetical protein